MKENWIKLHSKILEWEWYKNSNVFRVFIHCLLKANWKDGKFEGQTISKGSFVTSRKNLSEELDMSIQNIRTALKKLEKTKNLTIKTTNKFTIIKVNNYELYQQPNQQLTNNQPATNQQLTTIEEYKTISSISSIEEIRTCVYQFYENNFTNLLSSVEKEELDAWIDYFQNEEILKYGIRVAVLNRKTTMAYLNGIYQNWKDSGYKTPEECKPKQKKEKEKIELFEYDWMDDEHES